MYPLIVQEVVGPWQVYGDAQYQIRSAGSRKVLAQVGWQKGGLPLCSHCGRCKCLHTAHVRMWRRTQAGQPG